MSDVTEYVVLALFTSGYSRGDVQMTRGGEPREPDTRDGRRPSEYHIGTVYAETPEDAIADACLNVVQNASSSGSSPEWSRRVSIARDADLFRAIPSGAGRKFAVHGAPVERERLTDYGMGSVFGRKLGNADRPEGTDALDPRREDDPELETDGGVDMDPWPITATVEVIGGEANHVTITAMSEFLTEHPEGNLADRVRERAADELTDGEVTLEVHEPGTVSVVDTHTPGLETDGGEDWTEQYDTATFRGAKEYPEPGEWTLKTVGADSIAWHHEPDGAMAMLLNHGSRSEAIADGEPLIHELEIEADDILAIEDGGDVEPNTVWTVIAEALARYDRGEDASETLADLTMEHLEPDEWEPFSADDIRAGEGPQDGEPMTDGGYEYTGAFTLETELNHQNARARREFWKQHGRPEGPYYSRCTNCEETTEHDGSLLDADHAIRRHAGVHGGLDNEQAEIILTDAYGREIFRHHAIHRPEDVRDGDSCPECGHQWTHRTVSCPECGRIREEHRWKPEDASEDIATDGGQPTEQDPLGYCSQCGEPVTGTHHPTRDGEPVNGMKEWDACGCLIANATLCDEPPSEIVTEYTRHVNGVEHTIRLETAPGTHLDNGERRDGHARLMDDIMDTREWDERKVPDGGRPLGGGR